VVEDCTLPPVGCDGRKECVHLTLFCNEDQPKNVVSRRCEVGWCPPFAIHLGVAHPTLSLGGVRSTLITDIHEIRADEPEECILAMGKKSSPILSPPLFLLPPLLPALHDYLPDRRDTLLTRSRTLPISPMTKIKIWNKHPPVRMFSTSPSTIHY